MIAPIRRNRLTLFGGAVLSADSQPITGRAAQRHRVALLALLASTTRVHRSRDHLMTLLWPTADAERGRKLLSDSIYRINQALGGDAVTGSAEEIRLNRGRLSTDAADLEGAMDERDWTRVAQIYRGSFLDGFFLPDAPEFDQWIEVERAHYARDVGKAFEALAMEARDAGKLSEALEWWQRYSSLAPDDSRVAMELMRALEASGNRAGALRHARVHTTLLRDTIGLEPDRSLQELADEIATRRESVVSLSPRCNSIAVLPFNNVTGSDTHAHLADAVTEELMYVLTRTPGLHVASRTSAFAYRDSLLDVREVARRLSVAWILEGSVRRSGRVLRVAAQLTDASNGYQVWSDTIDRVSAEDHSGESEIAADILSRLASAMGGRFAVQRGMLMRERTTGNCVERSAS
jgi:TolB-like protein